MTKRSGANPTRGENQADLFGAAPHAAPPKGKPAVQERRNKTLDTSRSGQAGKPAEPQSLLNVRQAAARLGLSKSTLDKMRGAGKGPRFVKSTDRAIRYDCEDLDRWINARRSSSD